MERSATPALLVFAAVEVAALVLFLVYGRDQWFFLDEWDFLFDRDAEDLDDLLRPHNEHWSTLPILVYRVLWRLVELRSYVPYQALIVVLHLTAAVLLRAVMRRAGVNPWIATAAASLFALFAAGYENIVWAFQIGFVGSLVFGLTHLLLADHDGGVDGRDWLGLVAGLASLMCSGIGVTMTVVVGVAVLLRRGWRLALFHTVPLALCFMLWWIEFARDQYDAADPSLGVVARFVATGVTASFDAMGQLPGAGLALGALLGVGLIVAYQTLDLSEVRTRLAAPAALLVGGVFFLATSGLGRAAGFGPDFARNPRYLHLVAAFSLPAIAVAADLVARNFRMFAPVALSLLLIGVPGNIQLLTKLEPRERVIPSWVDLRRSLLLQSERTVTPTACTTLGKPATRRLEKGQSISIEGGLVRVFDRGAGAKIWDFATYDPSEGHTLTALAGPLTLGLAADDPEEPVVTCR